ncbi:MAG: 16S rRNA (guanine(966)-N(2))-methyltransferase RsmD [Anaerolineae bacterium]
MRVIGGKAKGRRLFSVPGQSTRPITDRVKEALFAILAEQVQGTRFLDLFAGTGGVGIEALSRGAREAIFVERDERALATLRRNLIATQLASRAQVVRRDVFKFISCYKGAPFDIIYVAPPQYQGLWAKTLQALDHSALLVPGTLVIAQIHPKEYQPLELSQLVLSDQRKYGSTLLCFYKVHPNHARS